MTRIRTNLKLQPRARGILGREDGCHRSSCHREIVRCLSKHIFQSITSQGSRSITLYKTRSEAKCCSYIRFHKRYNLSSNYNSQPWFISIAVKIFLQDVSSWPPQCSRQPPMPSCQSLPKPFHPLPNNAQS